MLVELILAPIFFLVKSVIGLIDGVMSLPSWIVYTIDLLSKGMMFFPLEVWGVVIANVTFWLVAMYSWSIIEWVYKKIPGVN